MASKDITQVDFPIPKGIKKADRILLADAIINEIVDRTQNRNIDRFGKRFAKYSKSYRKSLDFKIAGKSSSVDLTLSGDMLAALTLVKDRTDRLTIGFKDKENKGKAEGNILGTYGNPKPVARPRDFLGLPKGEYQKLLKQFKPEDSQKGLAAFLAKEVFGSDS